MANCLPDDSFLVVRWSNTSKYLNHQGKKNVQWLLLSWNIQPKHLVNRADSIAIYADGNSADLLHTLGYIMTKHLVLHCTDATDNRQVKTRCAPALER